MRRRLWVGLDVGADQMTTCVIDDRGETVLEESIPTDAKELHTVLRPYKRRTGLIGMEAGSHSIHLARKLRRLGYRVAMFDTRQASRFLAIRRNKTDANDARGLAEIARLGREAVSEVRVKSPECQRLRSTLVSRRKLVQLRVATESTIRSLFRINGGRLKSSYSAASLRRNVSEQLLYLRKSERVDLTSEVQPLVDLCVAMRSYLEKVDDQLKAKAEEISVCRRFLEIPGVGPICALSFYSAIEEPSRFSRNADVGAYLGMVPRVRQSGRSTQRLRISKMGCAMTRTQLVTAAMVHLRCSKSDLQSWGASLEERTGKLRAQMAVARKLATVMTAMWKSGEAYQPFRSNPGKAVIVPVPATN